MDAAIAACDPASLATFALGLVDAWESAGLPRAHRWVVFTAGHVASSASDGDLVRELATRVRRWPRQGHFAQAINGGHEENLTQWAMSATLWKIPCGRG